MPAVQGNYIPLSGQQRTLRTEIVWIFRRGSIRSGCTSPPSDPISTSFKPLSCTCRAPSPKIEQHAQARGPLQLTTDGTTTQHDNPTSQQLHSMLRTGPAGQILLHHAQDWHLLARSFFIMLKTGTCCSQLLRRAQLHQPPATITTATNNDSTPQRPASLHLSLAHQQPPQPRLCSHQPAATQLAPTISLDAGLSCRLIITNSNTCTTTAALPTDAPTTQDKGTRGHQAHQQQLRDQHGEGNNVCVAVPTYRAFHTAPTQGECSNSSTRTSYISPAFHQLFSRVSTFESPALTPDLAFRTINTGM